MTGSEAAGARAQHKTRARSRNAAPTFYVSGFWKRAMAALIDLAVILPMCWILWKVVSSLAGLSLPSSRVQGIDFWLDLFLASDPALLGVAVVSTATALVYASIFHIILGRTLGMRIMRIKIIDVYGDPPTTARAMLRSFAYLLGVLSLGLGFIWIAFDSEKRGVHDWIASTYVVKA